MKNYRDEDSQWQRWHTRCFLATRMIWHKRVSVCSIRPPLFTSTRRLPSFSCCVESFSSHKEVESSITLWPCILMIAWAFLLEIGFVGCRRLFDNIDEPNWSERNEEKKHDGRLKSSTTTALSNIRIVIRRGHHEVRMSADGAANDLTRWIFIFFCFTFNFK